VKRIFIICIVLSMLTACVVRKARVDAIDDRVTSIEDKIWELEERVGIYDAVSTNNAISAIRSRVDAIDNRLNTLDARLSSEPVVTPVVHIPGSILDDEVNSMYQEAYRLYEMRDYPSAIRLFTQITRQAPNHTLAANSTYWIGECYYAMADFSAARLAFQTVQDQYPDSNKFIDAQVKIAMTWIRQNRKDQARTILLAIKRDFPTYERMSVVDQNLRLTQ